MKRFLLMLFVIVTFSFSDDEQESFRFFTNEDVYNWSDCVKPANEYIENEIPKLKKQMADYIADQDSLALHLHFIDLNDDGNLDVIYSGTAGSAADYVVFYINTGNEYKFLFEEYTNIRELRIENNRLAGYTGLYLGCCAEYVQKETRYLITKDWKRKVISQKAKTSYTIPPKLLLKNPIKFKVGKDLYKLRSYPEINDTGFVIYDTISNVVSSYPKGSIGKAWSQETDKTGRIWWFVEMDFNTNQKGSRILSIDDSIPYTVFGWMSSKYLEKY